MVVEVGEIVASDVGDEVSGVDEETVLEAEASVTVTDEPWVVWLIAIDTRGSLSVEG